MTVTLVCLSGLPGTGKSTIARHLAARVGALWLRVDAVEQAMRDSHMTVVGDLADGGYAALQAVAAAALEQGFDVVADCVNPLAETRVGWQAVSARTGARHLDVALTCADRGKHRARVEGRAPEVPGLVLPDWAAVMARDWSPFDGADLHIDTGAVALEEAVARIAERMREN